MTPSALAGTLISHAAGLTSDSAAAELICAHHTWLTRTDFTATLHPRRHPPRPAPLRLHRLGTRHHRPRHPPAQLLALRSRRPAHRRQPRRPPHPRPPRPRPGQPRPHQHRPGHHRHHPRQRLTPTTRPPPRQPGHRQAPPTPSAGPFPSPVMPTQRDADVPNQRVAEHRSGRAINSSHVTTLCGRFGGAVPGLAFEQPKRHADQGSPALCVLALGQFCADIRRARAPRRNLLLASAPGQH